MKIGIVLDGLISSEHFSNQNLDNDLFCLNQIATKDGWHAVNRWFSQNHDVFIFTERSNNGITNRWLLEWNIAYNNVIYDLSQSMQYAKAVEIGCDIFVCPDTYGSMNTVSDTSVFMLSTGNDTLLDNFYNPISSLEELDMVVSQWSERKRKLNAAHVVRSKS